MEEKEGRFDVSKDTFNVSNLENYGMIPLPCLHNIFLFFDVNELPNIFTICKLWNHVGNTNLFWKEYYSQFFKMENKSLSDENSNNNDINFKSHFFINFFSPYKLRNQYFKDLFDGKLENDDRDGEYDKLYKIVLVGGGESGKTSLLSRWTRDEWDEHIRSTIGVEFSTKTVQVDEVIIKLQIWDTAGQERYRAITSAFYRGSSGVILCYDITSRESFERMKEFNEEVNEYNKNIARIFCGNKLDLEEKRKVSKLEIRTFMKENGYSTPKKDYCECSSKEKLFLQYPIGRCLEKILEREDAEKKMEKKE